MASDPDELSFTVSGYANLPEPAKQKLSEIIDRHASQVIAEAARLEDNWRGDQSSSPQITSRDIEDAEALIRRAPKKRLTTRFRVFDGAAFGAAIIAGAFSNQISTPGGAIGFAVSAIVAIIAYFNRGGD